MQNVYTNQLCGLNHLNICVSINLFSLKTTFMCNELSASLIPSHSLPLTHTQTHIFVSLYLSLGWIAIHIIHTVISSLLILPFSFFCIYENKWYSVWLVADKERLHVLSTAYVTFKLQKKKTKKYIFTEMEEFDR